MNRSGYSDDYGDDDPLALGRWRAQVNSAMYGKRGQAFLKELAAALDAMPEKRLIANALDVPVTGLPFAPKGGDCCALGAVGRVRQLDMSKIDPDDHEAVAFNFDIAHAMACEIMYRNDEGGPYFKSETPEHRWKRMRRWVDAEIKQGEVVAERRAKAKRERAQ